MQVIINGMTFMVRGIVSLDVPNMDIYSSRNPVILGNKKPKIVVTENRGKFRVYIMMTKDEEVLECYSIHHQMRLNYSTFIEEIFGMDKVSYGIMPPYTALGFKDIMNVWEDVPDIPNIHKLLHPFLFKLDLVEVEKRYPSYLKMVDGEISYPLDMTMLSFLTMNHGVRIFNEEGVLEYIDGIENNLPQIVIVNCNYRYRALQTTPLM